MFENHTDKLTSPLLFRKWAAIAAVAGALERKVWTVTRGSAVYPNIYALLVAPPGIGKSEVTWRVRDLWHGLDGHFVASTSVTKASMMDELNGAARRIVTNSNKKPVESFNSLKLCVNELGVLISAYDNEFMNTLTDLWDCKDYSETRRNKNVEDIDLQRVQLNMLAACTPAYLNNLLPEGAWDQGFISRTMLIYSGDMQRRSLFESQVSSEEETAVIQRSLDRIGVLFGEIKWSQEAAELIDDFNMRDGEPKPQHPKLLSYNVRRVVHLIKLCIIASMSESDELVITKEQFQRALGWMLEAEHHMPDIFKAMSASSTGKIMEETWYYLFTIYSKEQKPIGKHRLIQFLAEKTPVHNIETMIKLMEEGKMIEKQLLVGGAAYKPLGKRAPV